MKRKFRTSSEEETVREGALFAGRLVPGSVVAFFGDLGTGKTSFIRGICGGLGVSQRAVSPTFTIINEYRGSGVNVYHFDFYRIGSPKEAEDIGFGEYLDKGGICLIEWADRILRLLPGGRFDVHMNLGRCENEREITIERIEEEGA